MSYYPIDCQPFTISPDYSSHESFCFKLNASISCTKCSFLHKTSYPSVSCKIELRIVRYTADQTIKQLKLYECAFLHKLVLNNMQPNISWLHSNRNKNEILVKTNMNPQTKFLRTRMHQTLAIRDLIKIRCL